ncbi:hypothetical protein B0A48_18240 [Cryoendolithus antarcticus]|uniref:Uncharacterized protein n=1 Tax=Cryoendolithus antarcticus TaxID=1507870 RepID=A0A1V8S9V8_9PEZI|nr:hypothetical protein B0A48_18240 [Cryoendolithus antarcticus]
MDSYPSRPYTRSQRPSYPQLSTQSSSASSSAFQSSSSLNSIASPNSAHPSSRLNMPPQGYTSAPLPSPSSAQSQRSYFGSIGGSTQASHPSSQQSRLPAQQQQAFVGQRGNGAGAPETTPFLKDFNLVAEAAKRAQMACLMRDMGDVEL